MAKRFAIAIAASCLAVAVFAAPAWIARMLPHRPPALELRGTDLGLIWGRPTTDRTVEVENNRPYTIKVVRVSASCQCMQVDPGSFEVAPHRAFPLRLVLRVQPPAFDLTTVSVAHAFEVRLTLHDARGETHGPFSVTGRVRNAVALSEPSAYLGRGVRVRGAKAPAKGISFRSARPLRAVEVSFSSAGVLRGAAALADPVSGSIQLSLDPDVAPCTRTVFARLVGATADGERVSSADLPVYVDVPGNFYSVPDSLGFGPVPVGGSCTISVALAARSTAPFTITSIHAPRGVGVTLKAPTALIAVARPTHAGAFHGEAAFQLESGAGQTETLRLPVTYFGY